jgi:prevent-host-death family protein
MRSVPIYQLKNELSSFIQAVEAGEEVSITRRGAEVARLIPGGKPKLNSRASVVRETRKAFAKVSAFNAQELTRAGRKW